MIPQRKKLIKTINQLYITMDKIQTQVLIKPCHNNNVQYVKGRMSGEMTNGQNFFCELL